MFDVQRQEMAFGFGRWQMRLVLRMHSYRASFGRSFQTMRKKKSLKSFRRFLLKCETSAALYI